MKTKSCNLFTTSKGNPVVFEKISAKGKILSRLII